MHQIVANQLLADDPPETWQTVQRLDGLGYDWHTIMHMSRRSSARTSTGPSRSAGSPILPTMPVG